MAYMKNGVWYDPTQQRKTSKPGCHGGKPGRDEALAQALPWRLVL